MTGDKLQRDAAPGRLVFLCPGCKMPHAVGHSGSGPLWTWNGSWDKPTLNPSVAVLTGRRVDPTFVPEEGDPPECCHSFVRDGRIQFLDDCTHPLAGQTVDLPDWSEA